MQRTGSFFKGFEFKSASSVLYIYNMCNKCTTSRIMKMVKEDEMDKDLKE